MQLRQKQMHERRLRILNAAEALIRETGETDFSVRTLAATAEVSPATPFNLFGSKDGLLYELLLRSLEDVTNDGLKFLSKNPELHPAEAAEIAVDFFLDDPDFLRPLYRVLMGVNHPEHRRTFMSGTYFYWEQVAKEVASEADLSNANTKNAMIISLMSHFIGLLELWVQGDLDDVSFMNSAKLGALLVLMPFAAKKYQSKLKAQISSLKVSLVYLS